MRVAILLPDVKFTTPSGGYRVHYETAHQLAQRGHDVTLVHKTRSLRVWLRSKVWGWRGRPMHEFVPWFDLSPRVHLRVVLRPTRHTTKDADAYLFTSWTTTLDWPRLRGRAPAVVLVWDYEFWVDADPELRSSMRAAFAQPELTLVAGSDAVASMLGIMGLPVTATVPPGIDHGVFGPGLDVRVRTAVGLLERSGPRRGMDDAVAALERVHEHDRDTPCLIGGQPDQESDQELPNWLERRTTESDAQLAEFYRDLAVFVLPSRVEGFGLPALEAMACGAAVVVTDNGGSSHYARDGENCLVVSVGDPEAMGDAALRLLQDEELRARIAAAGSATAMTFTWERATDALERLLTNLAR